MLGASMIRIRTFVRVLGFAAATFGAVVTFLVSPVVISADGTGYGSCNPVPNGSNGPIHCYSEKFSDVSVYSTGLTFSLNAASMTLGTDSDGMAMSSAAWLERSDGHVLEMGYTVGSPCTSYCGYTSPLTV